MSEMVSELGPLLFWSPRCWSVSPHFHAIWVLLLQFPNSTNTVLHKKCFTHLLSFLSMLNFSIFSKTPDLSKQLSTSELYIFPHIWSTCFYSLQTSTSLSGLWGTDYKRRGSYLYHVSKDLCQDFLCTLRAEACLEYSSQPRSSALLSSSGLG